MKIDYTRKKNTLYVLVFGPLNDMNRDKFQAQLDEILTLQSGKLVFNFSNVTEFSAQTLEIFKDFYSKALEKNFNITIHGVNNQVFELLKSNRFDSPLS